MAMNFNRPQMAPQGPPQPQIYRGGGQAPPAPVGRRPGALGLGGMQRPFMPPGMPPGMPAGRVGGVPQQPYSGQSLGFGSRVGALQAPMAQGVRY